MSEAPPFFRRVRLAPELVEDMVLLCLDDFERERLLCFFFFLPLRAFFFFFVFSLLLELFEDSPLEELLRLLLLSLFSAASLLPAIAPPASAPPLPAPPCKLLLIAREPA